ncbi:MAG: hypothetical protein LQ343_000464 [Gyalolechia ehrenbergii]|nr:MAG: hypothetical protein LQ343_000464 [Gyalolechia ehrenbergii]
MAANEADYSNYIVYGPEANCTLALCPVQLSVYQYQPTLAGNIAFLVCITLAPAFYTAAIYITLYKMYVLFPLLFPSAPPGAPPPTLSQKLNSFPRILYLGPEHARFPPKAYYWIFIPCDILSLVLQSLGGALSSTSEGSSQAAVNVSIAGLSFQVFTLLVFIALTLEFSFRWRKARRANPDRKHVSRAFKIFVWFLSLSILFILIRCLYRIDELSEGYSGPLISNEGLVIALEGVMVLVALYCLIIAHPGPVFADLDDEKPLQNATAPDDAERSKETA